MINLKRTKFNHSSNIFAYWYAHIKSNGIWSFLTRASRYVRRYLFISRLIKYASLIIAVIETSATLVLVATAFVAAIPLAVISFSFTALLSALKYKKINPMIKAELEKADKIIFIEAKKGYNRKKSAYLNRMAVCFKEEGYTVIIVSRSFFTDRMLSAKKTKEGVWVVMLNYFFVIKRKFLSQIDESKLIYIY